MLEDAEWDPAQLHKWTEFDARAPNLKELSILRCNASEPEWAQSKLWEEHIPAGFPNLESFEVAGYIVRPLSVVRMFARYQTNPDCALKTFSVKNLNWRLLGQKELTAFKNFVQELSVQPQNKVDWSLSDRQNSSFFRLTQR